MNPSAEQARSAIVHAMRDAGVSQSELAYRLGLTRPNVTQLLTTRGFHTFDVLDSLAAALGKRAVVVLIDPPG
jgi:transcriptional regulator with XRE-family HTH domain